MAPHGNDLRVRLVLPPLVAATETRMPIRSFLALLLSISELMHYARRSFAMLLLSSCLVWRGGRTARCPGKADARPPLSPLIAYDEAAQLLPVSRRLVCSIHLITIPSMDACLPLQEHPRSHRWRVPCAPPNPRPNQPSPLIWPMTLMHCFEETLRGQPSGNAPVLPTTWFRHARSDACGSDTGLGATHVWSPKRARQGSPIGSPSRALASLDNLHFHQHRSIA